MLASSLELRPQLSRPTLRVCAVSYLNTAPLVFGFRQQPQPELQLEMALPAVCADRLREGAADIGLVPVAEIARQRLALLGDCGIACDGDVRSILLFARKPWNEVRTLAGDSSSRTSVLLAQIVLRERFDARVRLHPHPPDLEAMLDAHDAALVIGDPALQLAPSHPAYYCLDLGAEWLRLTGLPMVFAAWAGPKAVVERTSAEPFARSLALGLQNLDAIVEEEAPPRGIAPDLAREYLQRHIRFQLGEREFAGMQAFLERAVHYGLLAPDATPHRMSPWTHSLTQDRRH